MRYEVRCCVESSGAVGGPNSPLDLTLFRRPSPIVRDFYGCRESVEGTKTRMIRKTNLSRVEVLDGSGLY